MTDIATTNTAHSSRSFQSNGQDSRRETRSKILEAARALFAEEGFEKTSMRKIAARIGYSPTTIYHHFANKAELFLHLVEEVCEEFLKRCNHAMASHLDPIRRLVCFLETYIEMGLTHQSAYRIAFMLPTRLYRKPTDYFPKGSKALRLYRLLCDATAKCIAARGGPADNPHVVESAVQSIWTSLHGVTSLLITYPSFPWTSVDELKDNAIKTSLMHIDTNHLDAHQWRRVADRSLTEHA